MIDPETARQAAERWDDVREYLDERSQRDRAIGERGDALAVLVPQLLDQLAELRQENEGYDRLVIDQACERDALESEKAQLLDQLAEKERRLRDAESTCAAYKRAKDENDERFMLERDDARAERDALGERCRQLETLIREACDHGTGHYAWDEENDRAAEPPWWERAEAALGDPK